MYSVMLICKSKVAQVNAAVAFRNKIINGIDLHCMWLAHLVGWRVRIRIHGLIGS